MKKKSERNLTKSSTSLCRGVQIAAGRISNHLEEQTKASSKLAAQSTVAATEEASKAMLIRQAKPAESFDWIVRAVAVGGGIKWLVVGEQEASIRRSRCGRKQVLLSPLFQAIPSNAHNADAQASLPMQPLPGPRLF